MGWELSIRLLTIFVLLEVNEYIPFLSGFSRAISVRERPILSL